MIRFVTDVHEKSSSERKQFHLKFDDSVEGNVKYGDLSKMVKKKNFVLVYNNAVVLVYSATRRIPMWGYCAT